MTESAPTGRPEPSSHLSRRSFAKAGAGVAGAGLLGSLLAACTKAASASSSESSGNASGKPIKMLSTSYGNVIPWTTQGSVAQKFWAQQFNVELTQLDPGGDPNKQLSQLQDAAAQKWDMVLINAVVQGTLTGAAQKFIDGGTPVISFLNDVADPNKPANGLLTTIEVDNYQLAYDMTVKLCNALNGKGKIIETQGIAGGSNVIDRHRGFQDAVKTFPNIKVLASDYGGFVTDTAQTLWQAYVTKYPEIDGAFLQNEDMAFGALDALRSAGRASKTLLTAVDGTVRGCQAILAGQIYASVRHPASQVYGWPVILGALHLRNQISAAFPSTVTVPAPEVDKSNAASIIFLQAKNVNLV